MICLVKYKHVFSKLKRLTHYLPMQLYVKITSDHMISFYKFFHFDNKIILSFYVVLLLKIIKIYFHSYMNDAASN